MTEQQKGAAQEPAPGQAGPARVQFEGAYTPPPEPEPDDDRDSD